MNKDKVISRLAWQVCEYEEKLELIRDLVTKCDLIDFEHQIILNEISNIIDTCSIFDGYDNNGESD